MTRFSLLGVAGAVVICAGLGGCSKAAPVPPTPTEQEIHAFDSGTPPRQIAWHPYQCEDGRPVFVVFRDSGLEIDLRLSENGRPMRFVAPAQGLQYLGDAGGVVLRGSKLTTEGPGIGRRICSRDGWQ